MKKFIILLLAALMIVGLAVSCKPDPEPDAFKGTWKGTDTTDYEFTFVCDGFGALTYTVKHGDDTKTYEGTYKVADGYITVSYNEEGEDDTAYLYSHLIVQADVGKGDIPVPETSVGKYAFHADDESKEYDFPDNYSAEDYYCPFTKEGDEYSCTAVNPDEPTYVRFESMKLTTPNATATETYAVYKEAYDPEDVPELLCSLTYASNFKCTAGEEGDPWSFKCEDPEIVFTMKTQYTLSSNTLTIYMEGYAGVEELELTKQ